jgi:hypothetical protein
LKKVIAVAGSPLEAAAAADIGADSVPELQVEGPASVDSQARGTAVAYVGCQDGVGAVTKLEVDAAVRYRCLGGAGSIL